MCRDLMKSIVWTQAPVQGGQREKMKAETGVMQQELKTTKMASKPRNRVRGPGQILPSHLRRNQSRQHHDLQLLAPRTVRQYISVV